MTTLAGSEVGFADGNGTNALFRDPTGLTVDASGNLYVDRASSGCYLPSQTNKKHTQAPSPFIFLLPRLLSCIEQVCGGSRQQSHQTGQSPGRYSHRTGHPLSPSFLAVASTHVAVAACDFDFCC